MRATPARSAGPAPAVGAIAPTTSSPSLVPGMARFLVDSASWRWTTLRPNATSAVAAFACSAATSGGRTASGRTSTGRSLACAPGVAWPGRGPAPVCARSPDSISFRTTSGRSNWRASGQRRDRQPYAGGSCAGNRAWTRASSSPSASAVSGPRSICANGSRIRLSWHACARASVRAARHRSPARSAARCSSRRSIGRHRAASCSAESAAGDAARGRLPERARQQTRRRCVRGSPPPPAGAGAVEPATTASWRASGRSGRTTWRGYR